MRACWRSLHEVFDFAFFSGFVGEAEEVAGVDGGDDFGGEVGEGIGFGGRVD